MIRYSHSVPRRGIAAPAVALCLVVLVGFMAVTMDGGVLMSDRRQAQAAADAAALAAASDLYQQQVTSYPNNPGRDGTSGTAKASALTTAAANGYSSSYVTVNVASGTYSEGANAGQALPNGYAEVIVLGSQSRGFSSIFGVGSLSVHARAVARGLYSQGNGNSILCLNATAKNAFSIAATNTNVTCAGSIIVDSTDADAMDATGSNAYCKAPVYYVTGGYAGASYWEDLNGNQLAPKTSQPVTPDPLSGLAYPDPTTLTLQNSGTRTVMATEPQPVVLNPGLYGGISIQSGATAILNPGIYYMAGSGFSVSTASVTANGVLIFNGPKTVGGTTTKAFTITGGSSFTMSPMTTGTWAGITLFQERNSTPQMIVTAGSQMDVTGTFYAAAATTKITGNSLANTHVTIGSQYICDIFVIAGGSFNIGSVGTGVPARRINLVE